MSDWHKTLLGKIVEITNGYAFKSINFSNVFSEGSLPVVKIRNVANGDVNLDNVQYHKTDKKLSKYISVKGDILIAMTGNHPQALTQVVGAVSKQKINQQLYINQRVAKISSLPTLSIDDFIYYYLKDESVHEYLANQSSGSANQANISKSDIENLELFIPCVQEQKAITSVLSSLDDKIDLLHRQNKTLESMAETLFRQWFVEEAQDDWERKPLTKIATFTNGLACQKYPPKKGELGLPVLKIKELNSGITDSSDVATKDVKPDYIVEYGDIIFAWSASLMVKIWSGERCVLNQHLFNVKSNKFPKWFIYEWCKYYLDEFISISQSQATTMGHIKRKDLDDAIALIPSKDELDAMDIEMSALFESKVHKLRQIQTLEKLRDTLLPKLMSGEVRVKYTPEEIKQ